MNRLKKTIHSKTNKHLFFYYNNLINHYIRNLKPHLLYRHAYLFTTSHKNAHTHAYFHTNSYIYIRPNERPPVPSCSTTSSIHLAYCKRQRNARDLLMTELANRHFEKNYWLPVLRCPSAKTRTRYSTTVLRGSHRHLQVYFTRQLCYVYTLVYALSVQEREGMMWYCLLRC